MPKRTKTVCALCDEPSPIKMMTVYWAWTWPTGDRRCYKQFFDYSCAASLVPKIEAKDSTDACYLCNQVAATADDINLYATYYVPGRDRLDAFLTIHESCLSRGEQYFTKNSVRMPERTQDQRVQAAERKGNPWDSWGAMGLSPS